MPYASISRVCYTVSDYEYGSVLYPERARMYDQSQDLRYHHKRRRAGGGGGGCRNELPGLLCTEGAPWYPRTSGQQPGGSTPWVLPGGGGCESESGAPHAY